MKPADICDREYLDLRPSFPLGTLALSLAFWTVYVLGFAYFTGAL